MKEKVEVVIAQFNSIVGDLCGNTDKIINPIPLPECFNCL